MVDVLCDWIRSPRTFCPGDAYKNARPDQAASDACNWAMMFKAERFTCCSR